MGHYYPLVLDPNSEDLIEPRNFVSRLPLPQVVAFVLPSAIVGMLLILLADNLFDLFGTAKLLYKFHRLDTQAEVSVDNRLHNMKYNCPEIMGTEILKSELLTHRRPGLGSHLFLLSAVASIKTFCVVTNWMADVVYAMQGVPRWDNYVPPHPKEAYTHALPLNPS